MDRWMNLCDGEEFGDREREREREFLSGDIEDHFLFLSILNEVSLANGKSSLATDDGSSSCCCWASWETAAVFLGLHDKEISGEYYPKTCKRSRKTRKKQTCRSLTISHLRRIMKRHGRVTVRNQASTFDSSCQDLVFSTKPDKSVSSSDQDFFQSLILKACCSALLTLGGSLMSSDAIRKLETHLTEMDMVMLPMQNIWVSEVHHMDSLAQAKKILQGLVQS